VPPLTGTFLRSIMRGVALIRAQLAFAPAYALPLRPVQRWPYFSVMWSK